MHFSPPSSCEWESAGNRIDSYTKRNLKNIRTMKTSEKFPLGRIPVKEDEDKSF
jgi:hypothetical protein